MARAPVLIAALVAIAWGVCYVVIQGSLPSQTPLLLAGLRSLLGGVVLAALVVIQRLIGRRDGAGASGWWTLPPRRQLVTLAVANATLAFGAMYLAAGRSQAAVASVLGGLQPLLLGLAGWWLFRERPTPRSVGGMALALAGVVLLAGARPAGTDVDGLALAVVAAAAPAAGTVLMRRLSSSVDLMATTAAQFTLGGAVLLAVSAATERWSAADLSSGTLAGLGLLGILGTGIASWAWFWLLPRVELSRLGAVLYLVPVTGVAAALLAGERLPPSALAAAGVLFAGIALATARATDQAPNTSTICARHGNGR